MRARMGALIASAAPEASVFFLMYSNMILIAQIIATRRDPKANDPM